MEIKLVQIQSLIYYKEKFTEWWIYKWIKKINGVKDVEVTSNMIKSEILNLELEEDFYDIIGIDESAENDLEDMELYLQDGEIDLEKLKSGEEMILNFSMYADMYDIKVGDILSFELYDGEDIIKKILKFKL